MQTDRAGFLCRLLLTLVALALNADVTGAQEWPDLRTIAPDLKVPEMIRSEPAASLRVRQTEEGWDSESVYHALYLPTDWTPGKKYPVIVEYAGNGGYRDPLGDECSGRPEGCNLGYGMTAGTGCIWICLPYLNADSTHLAVTWWGDRPTYDPQPTLKYCRSAIEHTCEQFGGDRDRILLCGFSRGSIACNYLGLYDDRMARIWRAFVACSHYDGVRTWPYPDSDASSAAIRFARLNGRPQFICGEKNQTDVTRKYLLSTVAGNNLTFASTGFRNHSDQWLLRPCEARTQLRTWLKKHLDLPLAETNEENGSE
jgi:hypothetical protein